jgi:urea transport system permease protein
MKSNVLKRVHLLRVAALLIFVLFPFTGNDYLTVQLTQYFVYGIFAMSLSLVWGYGGILCFGHAVFFGIGAYVMALITKGMIPGFSGFLISSWIGLLLSMASVAFLAFILGYFLFYGRLSGPYLGIVTLAISVIAERVAVNWYYIGGFNGLTEIPALSFFGWEIRGIKPLFYFVLAAALGTYILCDWLTRSPFGTILAAIRDNETRAEFFGFNSANYKIATFSIGASVAGLAGALFSTVTEFVSPTILGFGFSTEVLIWVALGGKEVLIASFLGAVVVRMLEAFLSDILAYYWIMILGLFFVVCVMFFPRGIFGRLLSER